jgi:hypothetical protein
MNGEQWLRVSPLCPETKETLCGARQEREEAPLPLPSLVGLRVILSSGAGGLDLRREKELLKTHILS